MKSSRVNVTLPSAGTYDSNFQLSTPVFSRTFWVSDADLARAEASGTVDMRPLDLAHTCLDAKDRDPCERLPFVTGSTQVDG